MNIEDEKIERILSHTDAEYIESSEELSKENYESAKSRIEEGLKYGVGALVYRGQNENFEVLLVSNHWSDGWLMPGGGVEQGETLEDAVVREVHEEAGIHVEPEDPLRVERQEMFYEDCEPVSNYFIVYSARGKTEEIGEDLGDYDDEIEQAAWFSDIPENTRDREFIKEFIEDISS